MKNFRDVLDECGLMDLGFVGSKFKWFRNFANGISVRERLDIAVGTMKWCDCFPAMKVILMECGSSNHKPIIIHPCGVFMKQNKPWRFEQIWLEEVGCHEAIASAWSGNMKGASMNKVMKKLGVCQNKLQW